MKQAGATLLLLLAMTLPALAESSFPLGWGGGSARPQDYDFGTAPAQGAIGNRAGFIKARPDAAANAYFILLQCVKADAYLGKRVRLSARLKTIEASGAQLFMRVDGAPAAKGELSTVLAFYNMSDRPIKGTTDWQGYDIVLEVPAAAVKVCFGFTLVGGKGEAWADGFALAPVEKEMPLSLMRAR